MRKGAKKIGLNIDNLSIYSDKKHYYVLWFGAKKKTFSAVSEQKIGYKL